MFRPALILLPYIAAVSVSFISPPVPGYWFSTEERPNIIVIMADDLSVDLTNTLLENGWMPNLKEHLLDNGIEFTNAFVTNVADCPSRATYLTGNYSHNTGVLSNNSPEPGKEGIHWPGWLPTEDAPGKNESTIATWLHDAGYHTGYIGKYLNGYGSIALDEATSPLTYIPPGWDIWQALLDPYTFSVFDYYMNDNGAIVGYQVEKNDYQTDILAQKSTAFIEHVAETGQPFFLTVSPLAPHVEIADLDLIAFLSENDIKKRYQARIRPAPRHEHLIDGDDKNGELPSMVMKPSFNEEDITDKPSCPAPSPPYGVNITFVPFCIGDFIAMGATGIELMEKQYKSMAASVLAVDDMIRAIMNALHENNLAENTIVIFTSDNGWLYGEHNAVGKELPYEESIRIPLIILNPSSDVTGQAFQIVLNNDLAPTIAELAKVTPPYKCDGKSMVPLLQDPEYTGWHRKSFLIEHYFIPGLAKYRSPTAMAIRHISDKADFLYVTTYADPDRSAKPSFHEFYDMHNDPFQENSLPLSQEITQSLDEFLNDLQQSSGRSAHYLESF